jgi:hypothetical protein
VTDDERASVPTRTPPDLPNRASLRTDASAKRTAGGMIECTVARVSNAIIVAGYRERIAPAVEGEHSGNAWMSASAWSDRRHMEAGDEATESNQSRNACWP